MHSEKKTGKINHKRKILDCNGKLNCQSGSSESIYKLPLSKQGQPQSVCQGTGCYSDRVDTAEMEKSSAQRSRHMLMA